MARFEENDFVKLAQDVRIFLEKADAMARLATIPVLYLELPDAKTMHNLYRDIVASLPPTYRHGLHGGSWEYVDDHTIKFQPFAGVTIVLSCKQRFAVRSDGSVGYRDIAFKAIDLRKD